MRCNFFPTSSKNRSCFVLPIQKTLVETYFICLAKGCRLSPNTVYKRSGREYIWNQNLNFFSSSDRKLIFLWLGGVSFLLLASFWSLLSLWWWEISLEIGPCLLLLNLPYCLTYRFFYIFSRLKIHCLDWSKTYKTQMRYSRWKLDNIKNFWDFCMLLHRTFFFYKLST